MSTSSRASLRFARSFAYRGARHPHYRHRQTSCFSTQPPFYRESAIDTTTLLVAGAVAVGTGYLSWWYTAQGTRQQQAQEESVNPEKSAGEQPASFARSLREEGSPVFGAEGPISIESLQHTFVMVANMPPGRPGNLTPEQEAKLKDMWAQTLEFFGMSHDEVQRAQSNGSAVTRSPTDPEKKRKKSLLGRFRKDKSDGADSEQSEGAAINDKYGAGKQYEEALRSMKPEDIREAFWDMSKMDHPDAILLRFLRARKWDVHAANVMALSTLHWRLKDFKVDEDVMAKGEGGAVKAETSATGDEKKVSTDFMQQYRLGKSFFHGVDNEGRPMCHVRVRLHRGGEQCNESLERYTIHTIETGRMLLRPPVDTATIIFDMTDFSMANMDYTPVKFMIKVFEANYPESLGRVIVYKAPWIFSGIWKIIRGWLDPVVASKIDFASNVDELSQYIPKSQIIKELGGAEDWTYKYVEPTADENKLLHDTAAESKIIEARKALVAEYEAETVKWINGEDRTAARNSLAQRLGDNYWQLDPYVRARSLYDRLGVLQPGGKIDFYPEKNAGQKPAEAIRPADSTGVANVPVADGEEEEGKASMDSFRTARDA